MLEALHLTKVYKTKGGMDVKALDDVSIQFPESGMVFLLGKSGSGKSTLLNVCGGLDAPTSGAILVKGKSSENFSQSDFDSYRNTYVGFIFQEYNILEEFTVEDNIALALELQGKPKDKKVIEDLLQQVELTGYAKRKPNTLSGGQKQRIAIARALIKSPEIIMADEPTGALDSATGKQVFDTLKKLSKDKLVIVVSHDRDFAEMYGDRIIELKDGKILSDVTKTQEQQQVLTQNISIVGDTLCVKKGSDLSEQDFAEIKAFLSKTDRDVIIASGDQDVKAFREVAHIKDNGEKEVFKDSSETPMEKKEYSPEDSRFIRSKLPLRHAIRIGISGMFSKPVRLVFTVLLCTIAFIMFGLLSTMTFYDSEPTFKQTLLDSPHSFIKLGKMYTITEQWTIEGDTTEFKYDMNTSFTQEELAEYQDHFGEDSFGAASTGYTINVQSKPSSYWMTDVFHFAYVPKENSLRESITGEYPDQDNEICISSYLAEALYICKSYDGETGKVLDLTSSEAIIGKKITLDGKVYTVVGILDSGKISEKYEVLKESGENDFQLISGLQSELQDGLHLVVFGTETRLKEIADENVMDYGMDGFYEHYMVADATTNPDGNYQFPEWANANYSAYSEHASVEDTIFFATGKTNLEDNEVVVSKEFLYVLLMEIYADRIEEATNKDDMKAQEELIKIQEIINQLYSKTVDYYDEAENTWISRSLTKEEETQKFEILLNELRKTENQLTLYTMLYNDYDGMAIGETYTFTIAGVWDVRDGSGTRMLLADKKAKELWETQKAGLVFYSEYTTEYVEPEDAVYGTIFLMYDHSKEQTNDIWDIYKNESPNKDGSWADITTSTISTLKMVDAVVEVLSKVFLWVGLVLAIFAALLLSNLISASISNKTKEIGILRAVGARSFDVFKIFFSEAFVITAVCIVASSIGSIMCCIMINGILIALMGASLFVFGFVSFIILVAIALVTAVVATYLPVRKAAKRKPVESIRAL